MVIGLGAVFLGFVHLYCCCCSVGVFLLGFCFLSGFWQSVMTVYYLFSWPGQAGCSHGMPVGGGGFDTGASGRGG